MKRRHIRELRDHIEAIAANTLAIDATLNCRDVRHTELVMMLGTLCTELGLLRAELAAQRVPGARAPIHPNLLPSPLPAEYRDNKKPRK